MVCSDGTARVGSLHNLRCGFFTRKLSTGSAGLLGIYILRLASSTLLHFSSPIGAVTTFAPSKNQLVTSFLKPKVWTNVISSLTSSRNICKSPDGRGLKDYASKTMASGGNDLVTVDFEVYGRVQGVFFRKYTQSQGEKLGLRGYCRNTRAGTVSGTMEGPRQQVEQMKEWLRTQGSPQSRIEKADFRNERSIEAFSFKERFGVERTI